MIPTFLLLAQGLPLMRTWYLIPLVFVISLVYNSSRYESPQLIIRRSIRLALMILAFLGVVLIVLSLLTWGL